MLTKTEVAREEASFKPLGNLIKSLRRISPTADIVDRHDPHFDIEDLFLPRTFEVAQRGRF